MQFTGTCSECGGKIVSHVSKDSWRDAVKEHAKRCPKAEADVRTYSYFELKRGVVYRCNLDSPTFEGKFEYKLHKHYLVYRKTYPNEKPGAWQGVWNPDWYTETKASYKPVEQSQSDGSGG